MTGWAMVLDAQLAASKPGAKKSNEIFVCRLGMAAAVVELSKVFGMLDGLYTT